MKPRNILSLFLLISLVTIGSLTSDARNADHPMKYNIEVVSETPQVYDIQVVALKNIVLGDRVVEIKYTTFSNINLFIAEIKDEAFSKSKSFIHSWHRERDSFVSIESKLSNKNILSARRAINCSH